MITHKDWEILLKFGSELKKRIGVAQVLGDTEWNFIRASLQKEFQMAFINDFFRLIEQEAQGDEENA